MIGNINRKIGTIFLLLFFCGSSSTECMLFDFGFDLFGFIGHENSCGWDGSRHFCLETLERWEEFGIETGWLWCFNSVTDISCHSEIRILINTAWDQTRKIFLSKNMWETWRKTGSCLDSRVRCLSAIIRELKTKYGFQSAHIDIPLHSNNIWIHCTNIFCINEYESFFWIKSKCNDILDVVISHALEIFKITLFPEVFLIVWDLYDQWHIESLLKVFIENKRQHMT